MKNTRNPKQQPWVYHFPSNAVQWIRKLERVVFIILDAQSTTFTLSPRELELDCALYKGNTGTQWVNLLSLISIRASLLKCNYTRIISVVNYKLLSVDKYICSQERPTFFNITKDIFLNMYRLPIWKQFFQAGVVLQVLYVYYKQIYISLMQVEIIC